MSYAKSIFNIESEFIDFDNKHNRIVKFIVDNFKIHKRITGIASLEQQISNELKIYPNIKKEYEELSNDEKEKFWLKVSNITKLLE